MVNKPPHLPSETCRVDTHHKILNLRWIFFIFFIAVLSGASAAMITTAWIVPQITSLSYYGVNYGNKNQTQLDILTVKQIEQRVLKVYDKRKKTSNNFYAEKAVLGEAVIISSDGWAVIYYPNYLISEEKNWEVVDYQGVVYKTQKAFYDSVSKLTYFKTDGEGLRIVSFVSTEDLLNGEPIWQLNKNWSSVSLTLSEIDLQKSFSIWQPQATFAVETGIKTGTLLFNKNGALAGIAQEKNLVIAPWIINNQLGNLLSAKNLVYSGLPVKGYMVSQIQEAGIWKKITGFYVTESNTIATENFIGKGDLITKINGQNISIETLAEKVLMASEEMEVTVYRNGEEINLKLKKTNNKII